MTKKWLVCILIISFVGLIFGCKHNNTPNMLVLSERPEGDKLTNIVIPSEDEADAHKALAYYLYDNANMLDQLCEKRIATSYCPVTTTISKIEVTVEAYVYDIKNADEWFLLEYQAAKHGLGKFASMFSKDMVFGKRSYYKLGMEALIEQRVSNAIIGEDRPYSNWDNSPVTTTYEIPYFHYSQELLYEKTEIVIRPETILSATVEYDSTEGIYKINMQLDVDNPLTTSKTLVNLKKGAGDTAVYTSISEYIEIWDNGYFKSFLSTDKWKSNTLKAVLPYHTTYSYNQLDCDIHSYEEATGLMALIKL